MQDLIDSVTLKGCEVFWNERASRNRGKKVGCEHNGYFVFNYKRKQYKLHRLIMLLRGDMTVEQFKDRWLFVDHIDGNGLNNSKENLRLVCPKGNQHNHKVHRQGRPLGTIVVNDTMYWRTGGKVI